MINKLSLDIILDFPNCPSGLESMVLEAATLAMDHLELNKQSLAIVISDDNYLRKLNLEYRGIDKTTDVLSFGSSYFDPGSNQVHLGDIAISFPEVQRNCREHSRSVKDEISLLTIHGILHLAGFDHSNPVEKEKMWDKQNELLFSMGIKGLIE